MDVHKYDDKNNQQNSNNNKYQQILDQIEETPCSSRFLEKKFCIDKSQLRRDFLEPMIDKKEIIWSSTLFKGDERRKFVFDWLVYRPLGSKTQKCYFRTKRSGKLYFELFNEIGLLRQKETASDLLNEMCESFQAIEISSKTWYNWLMDDKETKKDLKRNKIEPTKINMEEEKKRKIKVITNFSVKKKRLGIILPIDMIIKDDKGNTYIKVKDRLVPFEKLEEFMNKFILKQMSIMMDYAVHSDVQNLKEVIGKLHFNALKLFIEIEEQSQMKI